MLLLIHATDVRNIWDVDEEEEEENRGRDLLTHHLGGYFMV